MRLTRCQNHACLSAICLTSFFCGQYVQIAQGLAADKQRLQEFRTNLRHDFLKSPLGDGPRYQRNVEDMYQVLNRLTACAQRAFDEIRSRYLILLVL